MYTITPERHGGAERTARPTNPFTGTTRLTLPARSAPTGIEVYAPIPQRVIQSYDEPADAAIYLWGRAVHPDGLSDGAMLRWAFSCVHGAGRREDLRKLLGHFVIVIDDRRHKRVTFISDVLGVHPWFVGVFDGRLVAGGDVLAICNAGFSAGRADLDALSSWLIYNLDCTGGSVVDDYKRLGPGTIDTYDTSTATLVAQTSYAPIRYGEEELPIGRMVETLHDIVSRSFDLQLRGVPEANMPLSGGYDSRYVCALAAARRGALKVHLATVQTVPEEAIPARQVADALELPLRVLSIGNHLMDLFDDPFSFGPEGFPTARNLTSAVARMHPGIPVVSGFMGDVLMRAPLRQALRSFLDQDREPMTDEAMARSAHDRYALKTNRLDLLRDGVEARADERARRAMLKVIQNGRASGRPLMFSNLHLRHRLYFAAIFLGHQDVADAILPYYSWDLIDFSTAHATSLRAENHRLLFERYFPALAAIPHDTQVLRDAPSNGTAPTAVNAPASRSTRHLRDWSVQLMGAMLRHARQTGLTPRKVLARASRGLLLNQPHIQVELMFMAKIHLFETRLRRAKVELDWTAI